MTLTEEQRGTVGFDLEKARSSISHYRIENHSNVDTESALKELVDQANLAEDALAEIERLLARDRQAAAAIVAMAEGTKQHVLKTQAIMKCVFDEADQLAGYCEELGNIVIAKDAKIADLETKIVRLRPFEIAARDLDSDLTKIAGERDDQAARIKELESSLDEAETLTKKNAELMNAYLARIAELEDALAEERAGAIRCEFNDHCEIDLPDAMIRARQELQADGKIGPDAKPRVWQITEERKAAIWHAIKVLKENDIMEEPEEHLWDEEVTVLQAMLKGAE